MSPDEIIVLDIIRAARLVLDFKQGLDKTDFLDDIKTQSAVLHQLMVMGEAVKRLSMNYRDSHPHIPWKAIAGMRDVLIHGYDIVDRTYAVRRTICTIVPVLGQVRGTN